ncbi:Protein kinase domain-containing protein [Mycena indigotica]|uniref:Protein kinase domain-containing protein n=1 Tax=Mycena indigotica TaxID=2126181 RepID=A0A8H6TAW9_9AGAR|nr:Protein kinase domain-containing protein [Mycena indigotica]KAF7312520.1 Protein kinase domain-containing protein [Mycena indigotica]
MLKERLQTAHPNREPLPEHWFRFQTGHLPISIDTPGFHYDHNGNIFRSATQILVNGDRAVMDSGAAIDIIYSRNKDVEDCPENRALDARQCLDWATTKKILTQIDDTLLGWKTEVTLKTLRNGSMDLQTTHHKHHDVGNTLPDNVVIDRLPVSAIRLHFNHRSGLGIYKAVIAPEWGKYRVFKGVTEFSNPLQDLEFFASLPHSDHLIRPTHAVVDESGNFRGMLMDFHYAGNLAEYVTDPRLDNECSCADLPPFGPEATPPLLENTVLFPLEVKLGWARDIAAAVAWLHQQGVFWGDLHLHNVILCNDGRCRLIDYYPDPSVWTPRYSPPELIIAERARELPLTPQRDAFHLGIALWALIEEAVDFTREVQWVRPCLPWRESTPRWLVDVVESCLATDPNERSSVQDVYDVLLSHVE